MFSAHGSYDTSMQTCRPTNRVLCTSCSASGLHSQKLDWFHGSQCQHCRKTGHIASTFQSITSKDSSQQTIHQLQSDQKGPSRPGECHVVSHCSFPALGAYGEAVQSIKLQTRGKIKVTVSIQGVPCEMEVDSGSALSIISMDTFPHIYPQKSIWYLEPFQVYWAQTLFCGFIPTQLPPESK